MKKIIALLILLIFLLSGCGLVIRSTIKSKKQKETREQIKANSSASKSLEKADNPTLNQNK